MAFTPRSQVLNPLGGFNLVPQDAAQQVTVAKSGAMFASIQAAIDSITDASTTTKPYIVRVYPGIYTENIVSKNGISIVGDIPGQITIVGTITATGITQSVGFEGFTLRWTPTADGQSGMALSGTSFYLGNITVVAVGAGDFICDDIQITSSSTCIISAVAALDFRSGTISKEFHGFHLFGTGTYSISEANVSARANYTSASLCLVQVDATGPLTLGGGALVFTDASGTFSGEVRGFCCTSASTADRIVSDVQIRLRGISGGTATGFSLDSSGGSASINYNNCTLAIDGFANEYSTNTGIGDTQKIWNLSQTKNFTKIGSGLSIVTPYDHYDSGFVAWGAGTTYWTYTPATRLFKVDRRGTGVVNGAPATWAADQSITLVNFASNYVYMTSAGIIGVTQTTTKALYIDNIVLFEVFVQDQNSIVVKENHPYEFTTAVSHYLHNTDGPLLQSDSSVLGVVSSAGRTFSFTGDNVIADNGLESTVPTTSPIPWIVTGRKISGGAYIASTGTAVPTYYNSVAAAVTLTAGTFVVGRSYEITSAGNTDFTLIGAQDSNVGTVFTATGVGTGTGQARQLSDDGSNGNWFVFKTGVVKESLNSATPTFLAHYHTAVYATQTAARNAIAAEIIDDFPPEIKQLEIARVGYLIIQGNGAGVNGANGAVTPVTDLQVSGSYSSSGGTSTVGALITLDTTGFNGELTGTEGTVQAAFERLDDYDSVLDWGTGKTYRVGNTVKVTATDRGYEGIWRCAVAHTAAAAFSTDIESGNWELMAYAEGVRELVFQAAHGFAVKEVVYHNGTQYAKSKADVGATAEVAGIVIAATTNKFIIAKSGRMVVTGLTVGDYFLSDATAGLATQTEPTTVGSISKPIFRATSATEAEVNIMRGSVVGGSGVQTSVALSNNAATNVQDLSAYEGCTVSGNLYVNGTADYRGNVMIMVSKKASDGTYVQSSSITSGDTDPGITIGITSAGVLQITLPSIAGFVDATFNYTIGSPQVGATFPLTVNGAQIIGGVPSVDGIKFPATQVPSADANTLDDYEEGTWTPGIAFGGASVGVTYSSRYGNYTKIGNRVLFHCFLSLSSKGSSTGVMTITGLPFTSATTVNGGFSPLSIWTSGLSANGYTVTAYVNQNNTTCGVEGTSITADATTSVQLTDTRVSGTASIMVSGSYIV